MATGKAVQESQGVLEDRGRGDHYPLTWGRHTTPFVNCGVVLFASDSAEHQLVSRVLVIGGQLTQLHEVPQSFLRARSAWGNGTGGGDLVEGRPS